MMGVFKGMLLLLVGALLLACQDQPDDAGELVRPVRYQAISADNLNLIRTFPGVARAGVESRLSFRVAGRIEQMIVKVGDRVPAGSEIARLDAKDYILRSQEAEASLAQAQANYRNASSVLQRVRRLYESNNASRNELDSARASADAAKAAVDSIENSLALAKRQMRYTNLKSPADCSVASVLAEVNENVGIGQPVVLLACGKESEVKVSVPGSVISGVHQGDATQVSFSALNAEEFKAIVTEVGVAADELADSFPVIVKLTAEDNRVRSGMAAEVTFTLSLEEQSPRTLVPVAAVAEDQQGRFVYVAQPSEDPLFAQAQRRPVEVGRISQGGIELLTGVQEGDLVITAGIKHIRDGQKVKLLSAPSL